MRDLAETNCNHIAVLLSQWIAAAAATIGVNCNNVADSGDLGEECRHRLSSSQGQKAIIERHFRFLHIDNNKRGDGVIRRR